MLFRKPAPPIPVPKPDGIMSALTFADVMAHASLEPHARHLAVKSEPALLHTGVTAPEAETIDLAERRIAARANELGAQAEAITEDIRLLGAPPDVDPPILQQRIIDAVAGAYAARTPAIHQSLATERSSRARLTAWRDERHITRPARYPRSRIVHFRWLLAIIGVEALLDGSMLLAATPDGLLGAATLGLAIAALTTGLGLAIGYGALRYIAAPGILKRTIGCIALPILSIMLGFVALYVAHYRHLAGASDDAPGDAAVAAHLLGNPLELSGQGLILLVLSLVCAGYAALKGYTASDPIPGYEAVDRAFVDARDDLDYLRADIRGAIGAIRTANVAPLLEQPKRARAKAEHVRGLIIALQHKRDRMAALDSQETALAQRAIAQFRRINRATRADGVTPAYFAETPVISAAAAPIPSGLEAQLDVASQRAGGHAAAAAEFGLHLSRMLDRTLDCTDEIMASVERTNLPADTNPSLALRASLEATLTAPTTLAAPVGHSLFALPSKAATPTS